LVEGVRRNVRLSASVSRSHRFNCGRREFLRRSAALALGTPFALGALAEDIAIPGSIRSKSNVAIVPCRSYAAEVMPAFQKAFDLVGGIDKLVRAKTVTVKLNLTGTDFTPFLGRNVGETYMTHEATVMALLTLLFKSGATRVRLVESTQSMATLPESLVSAGWNIKAIDALGKVEYENTRNLGAGKSYAHLKVPNGGYFFSSFDFNHSYHDTDVMVSMAKLKRHLTAGVTLSMKNLFGITPNSLYGEEAGNEHATKGRAPLHYKDGFEKITLPGLRADAVSRSPFERVPKIVVDICSARPIDIAIIDGISAMTVGEGPWCGQAGEIKLTTPGVLIVGLNPVSTDAVATAVMGYDPRAPRMSKPFENGENHLLLAEKAGLGTADLAQIDVRGMTVDKARYAYD
jgi:uncharacterized protein (DUF362 family)